MVRTWVKFGKKMVLIISTVFLGNFGRFLGVKNRKLYFLKGDNLTFFKLMFWQCFGSEKLFFDGWKTYFSGDKIKMPFFCYHCIHTRLK